MQLTQPANNSKNASDHCCDQFFFSCFNYTSSKWLIFQIEINKKHNFCKLSYHSWFGTNDNKTSVIERKQNHKLWIINTAFIRGFTCMLNFEISWIQCPHNKINNNNCVNFKCVSLTEKVLHRKKHNNDSQVRFVWSFCMKINKANLRDLIAATSLVILLKLDSNHWFFQPIWPRNLMDDWKNNRATHLGYINLCALFQSHHWIQTGVTIL